MTNYDRWKLATPDYLEDTDESDKYYVGDSDDCVPADWVSAREKPWGTTRDHGVRTGV